MSAKSQRVAAAPTYPEHDLDERVGRAIRMLRQKRNMTQTQLAERCGVAQEAISQMENGKRFKHLHRLHQVSLALGCRLDDLIELALIERLEDEILDKRADEAIAEAERKGWIPLEEVEKELGL